MNKRGISLVALVVTIIVLIILTGAVVATFMEGGIIDKAKDAVMRSDCETLKEAYVVNYNVAKIDVETSTGGEVDVEGIVMKSAEDVGLEKDFKNDGILIYTGENKYIKEWLGEIGIISGNEDDIDLLKVLDAEGYIYNLGYITGITSDRTSIFDIIGRDEFKEKYEMLDGNTYIGTGDKIVRKGTQEVIATVVKYGDTNGDVRGAVNSTDYGQIKNYLLKKNNNVVEEIGACDVNHDGYVTFADSQLLKDIITNVTSEEVNQEKPYNPNTEVIDRDKILSGISSLSYDSVNDMYTLTLNEEKTTEQMKSMFMPYMKAIYAYTEGTEEGKTTNGENININGFDFTISIISE